MKALYVVQVHPAQPLLFVAPFPVLAINRGNQHKHCNCERQSESRVPKREAEQNVMNEVTGHKLVKLSSKATALPLAPPNFYNQEFTGRNCCAETALQHTPHLDVSTL